MPKCMQCLHCPRRMKKPDRKSVDIKIEMQQVAEGQLHQYAQCAYYKDIIHVHYNIRIGTQQWTCIYTLNSNINSFILKCNVLICSRSQRDSSTNTHSELHSILIYVLRKVSISTIQTDPNIHASIFWYLQFYIGFWVTGWGLTRPIVHM